MPELESGYRGQTNSERALENPKTKQINEKLRDLANRYSPSLAPEEMKEGRKLVAAFAAERLADTDVANPQFAKYFEAYTLIPKYVRKDADPAQFWADLRSSAAARREGKLVYVVGDGPSREALRQHLLNTCFYPIDEEGKHRYKYADIKKLHDQAEDRVHAVIKEMGVPKYISPIEPKAEPLPKDVNAVLGNAGEGRYNHARDQREKYKSLCERILSENQQQLKEIEFCITRLAGLQVENGLPHGDGSTDKAFRERLVRENAFIPIADELRSADRDELLNRLLSPDKEKIKKIVPFSEDRFGRLYDADGRFRGLPKKN